MSATCRTGPGGTHLLGLRSRGGRGRLRARVLPSPSRARDVWPGAAPASPVPPPSRRGWERPEAAPGGRGPLSARPLRPAPHCPGGGTLRGPGAGSPPGRAVAPPLARAAPSSFAGGRRAPRAPPRRPQRSLGHQLPLPPGALSPSEITDAAGGWVDGVGGNIPSLRVTWLQSWGIGETGQTSLSLPAPRFERGKPERVSSAGGPHSTGGRGQRGCRASFRRQVSDCTVAQAGIPVREGSARGVVAGGSGQVTSWQKAREEEAASGGGVGRSWGRGAVWTETPVRGRLGEAPAGKE